jgi:putative MATE family efflux protein
VTLLEELRRRFSTVFRGKDQLELTSGSIGEPLFFLSLPIIVTNLLQVAYNLADTFWLGQYSTEALAAISFAFPMVFFLISLGMGISVAGSVLVAQHTGADEPEKAQYAASQTVTFAVLASVFFGVTGYFFVEDFLRFVGASESVLPGATAYLQVMALGLAFLFGFIVFISLMRGSGDTVTPMLVMFGTVVLNVVLDPFLIFGWTVVESAPLVGTIAFPELGVQGAAIATIFSRGVAMAVGLAIMLSGARGVKIVPREMVPDPAYVRKLLRIGVPASIEGTGRSISVNLMLIVVGTFSTPVVAAFGVGTRIFSLIFMPAIAVDRGVETMTGQNIGADKPDRANTANHFAAKASFGILAAVGVVVFFTAPTIVGVFSPDEQVVRIGAEFLRWVAPTFGFIGVVRAYSGGFRGSGKTLTAAALAILMLGFIRLPVSWVASRVVDVSTVSVSVPGLGTFTTDVLAGTLVAEAFAHSLGSRGIWLGFAVSNVLAALLAWAWFSRGTWRETDITDDPATAVADD